MAFDPVYSEEVSNAVWSLASNKAPGPDGYPVDIFRYIPNTYAVLAQLFTTVIRTGHSPARLLDLFIIPFDKPRNPEAGPAPKRPISLICSLAKVLEAAALHRTVPVV